MNSPLDETSPCAVLVAASTHGKARTTVGSNQWCAKDGMLTQSINGVPHELALRYIIRSTFTLQVEQSDSKAAPTGVVRP